jgi:PAS domain S-box-containing protein
MGEIASHANLEREPILLRRQNERLELLAAAAGHLLATDDPEAQIQDLYEKVAAHLEADTYFNFTVGQEGDTLELDFCRGIPEERIPSFRRLAFGQAICGTVAQTGEPIHACDIQNSDYDKAALVRSLGIRCYCCYPLIAGERLLGTLSFASHTRDHFDPDEVEFMRTVCHYVAMAKERARLLREAQEEARRHRQTEERYRLLFERMRLIADNAPAYISNVDTDYRYLFVNRANAERFGFTVDEVVGKTVGEIMGQPAFETIRPYMERAFQGETVYFESVIPYARVGTRYMQVFYAPEFAEDGRVRGLIAIIHDITARKQMEEERTHHVREIERLNERLRQAIQETDHRVKNNLQILAAMVDLQTMEGREMLPVSEFARLAQHIRALAAVHEALTRQAQEDKTEAISVRVILERLLPMLQQTMEGCRLSYALEDTFLPIRQVSALALCTNELVSNAVKHGSGQVYLSFTVREDAAALEVFDNGPGFPPGFDPVASANTGLQLVGSLAAWDLHGAARFENRAEGGACVTITLPRVFPAPSRPKA